MMLCMSSYYKGRILSPRVFERKDSQGWTAEVFVAENDGGDTVDSHFILNGTFPSEDAAQNAALHAGKRVVDNREIESVIEDSTQLPSTSRSAYGNRSDDLAFGRDGYRKGVPSSGNPEDRFD